MQSKKSGPGKSADRYLVFTRLVRFSRFMPVSFLLILPATMCIGFLIPGFFTATLYALVGYAVLILVYLLINQYRYHFVFKGWKERLPFRLEGWDELLREKNLKSDTGWNHVRMEIGTINSTQHLADSMTAALKKFCKVAGDAFYDQQRGSVATHDRLHWKISSSAVAEGSANTEVLRHLKNFFEQELSSLAKQTGKIEHVKIAMLSPEFEVEMQVSAD